MTPRNSESESTGNGPAEIPEWVYSAGAFVFTWKSSCVQIKLDRLRERKDGLAGEMTVVSTAPGNSGHLHQARVALTSTSSRDTVTRILSKKLDRDWSSIIEQACVLTLRKYRQGDPVLDLSEEGPTPIEQVHFLIEPLLPEGEPTIIYADGESGKSMLACFLAVLAASGYKTAGLTPKQTPVLYLDYENQKRSNWMRIRAITAGLELKRIPRIFYRSCHQSVPDDLEEINRLVSISEVGLVIVDSFGGACGGEMETSEPVMRYFRAINSIPATVLTLDHIAKNIEEGKRITPYGSTYKRNYSRCLWEMHKSQENHDEGYLVIGLFNRKFNDGPRPKPIGFRLDIVGLPYRPETITFTAVDPAEVPDLRQSMTTKDQIASVLKTGAKTVSEISEETGLPREVVKKTLNRSAGKIFINLTSSKGHDENQWGLISNAIPGH